VRPLGGQVIVDDTQALGIFGHPAGAGAPYGVGGGGSLRRWHISDRSVIVISSLAKGFGVPMAVMAGSRPVIARFESASETRVHCSPPSIATLHAAEHALDVNEHHGEALRLRLAQNMQSFHERLSERNMAATGGLFPVQTLRLAPEHDAVRIHERLQRRGIATVLHRGRNGNRPRISFIITAQHTRSEIERATAELLQAIDRLPQRWPQLGVHWGYKE